MKFKNINILFTLLYFNLKVFSVPLKEKELFSNLKNNSDISEIKNISDSINISEDGVYDTLPVYDNDVVIESASVIETEECTSKECIEFSKRILSNMDTSVDPCDDFYEFSCGGWIAENNKKEEDYSIFKQLQNQVKDELINILESDYKPNAKLNQKEREYDEIIFNIMKDYYNTCVKSNDKVDNENEIINFINSFNITESLSNPDGLALLLAELHSYNFEILYNMDIDRIDDFSYLPYIRNRINFIGTTTSIKDAFIEVELSKEGLSSKSDFKSENEYNENLQENNKIIDIYQEYIRKILQTIYGSNKNKNKIDSIFESVITVEKNITKFKIDKEKEYNYYPITISEQTDYEEQTNYENDEIESNIYTEYLMDEQYTNNEYDNNENEDIYENGINIKTLNEMYPLINWKLYIEKMFEYNSIEIPVTDETLIDVPKDFKDLFECLQEINNNDLVNYFEWKIIQRIIKYNYIYSTYSKYEIFQKKIFKELFKITKEYEKFIEELGVNNDGDYDYGHLEYPELIKDVFSRKDIKSICLNEINVFMPFALSKYYVDNTFPEKIIKPEVKDMIEDIKKNMIYRINKLEWLDDSTKEYAIEKVLKMKYIIGYSDYITNVENIYNKHKSLKNVKNDELSHIIKSINNRFNSEYYEIPYIDRYENSIQTFVVNAIYVSEINTMIFPAALFHSPIFDINQPYYLNYGNIGFFMGHELTHGFDNSGKNYDPEGNFKNWWTVNDDEEYNEFSQCFVNQYNNYDIDGRITLNENLADNGGINRAYEAWKLSMKNNSEKIKQRNMKLPGLSNYTMDQLFYISFGQNLCAVGQTTPPLEDIENQNLYDPDFYSQDPDPHAPGRYRVIGSLSNNKYFNKIFNCPTKSPMNTEKKCTLW